MTLSLFNNDNANVNHQIAPTTGLVLQVDTHAMTVRNLRTLADASSPIYAVSQDNTQLLGNTTMGHVFMDYGAIGVVREYDGAGNTIMSAQFGPYNGVASYRGFKYDWHATPFWDPAAVVQRSSSDKEITVFMSWNGATDYDSWAVYGGPSQALANATMLKTVPRTGFETNVTIPAAANVSYIQAVARQGGSTLRASTEIAL